MARLGGYGIGKDDSVFQSTEALDSRGSPIASWPTSPNPPRCAGHPTSTGALRRIPRRCLSTNQGRGDIRSEFPRPPRHSGKVAPPKNRVTARVAWPRRGKTWCLSRLRRIPTSGGSEVRRVREDWPGVCGLCNVIRHLKWAGRWFNGRPRLRSKFSLGALDVHVPQQNRPVPGGTAAPLAFGFTVGTS